MTAISSMEGAYDRRWGFGLAVAAHTALFAIGGLLWQQHAEYGMDASQGAVDIELVAAPPAATVPQTAVISTPPPPVLIPDRDDVVQAAKIPVAQPLTTPLPTPVAVPKPASATSDGSAAALGTDAATLHRTGGSQAVSKPGYQRNPPPAYPPQARRLKQEGRVLLSVSVTAEGRVSSARIQQSSGFPLLDEAALRGVQNWRFRAASIGGLRVASDVEIPIRFQLK